MVMIICFSQCVFCIVIFPFGYCGHGAIPTSLISIIAVHNTSTDGQNQEFNLVMAFLMRCPSSPTCLPRPRSTVLLTVCRKENKYKVAAKEMFFKVINQQSFHRKCQMCSVFFGWMVGTFKHLQHLSFTLAWHFTNLFIDAKIIPTFPLVLLSERWTAAWEELKASLQTTKLWYRWKEKVLLSLKHVPFFYGFLKFSSMVRLFILRAKTACSFPLKGLKCPKRK